MIIENFRVNAADILLQPLSKVCINFILIRPIVLNCVEIQSMQAQHFNAYNNVLHVLVHRNHHQAPLLQMLKNICIQYAVFPLMDAIELHTLDNKYTVLFYIILISEQNVSMEI